jgi:two-component system cell cycle sensor histidine kinase/response regulator CckA
MTKQNRAASTEESGSSPISVRQFRQTEKMVAVGLLASGIAHDFNNLLTVINGHASLALRSPAGAAGKHLEIVRTAGEQAAAMVRRLLSFSRPGSLARRLDLNFLVGEVAQLIAHLLPETIRLDFHAAPDIAPVMGEPGAIQQVIVNLAINSRDAIPERGTISIETANLELPSGLRDAGISVPPGRYVRLSVRDTGCGMDAATREHLFEPFYTTKPTGTGLGLATVRSIVDQSNGHISVCSAPGEGTAVHIYLPKSDGPIAAVSDSQPDSAAGGNETILVVEDNDQVLRFCQILLEDLGYKVVTARTAAEAIDKSSLRPDLLISDFHLPDSTGSGLAENLREVYPDLPTLIISGYPQSSIDPRTAFIEKPFDPNNFTARIRTILDARR